MPASRHLSREDPSALVDHVLHLSGLSREPANENTPASTDPWFSAGISRQPTTRLAPDLTVTSLAGKTRNLENFRGKVPLLHFWGTNCIHCLQSLPTLTELVAQLDPGRFAVLNVCVNTDDVKQIQKLTRRFGKPLTFYVDEEALARFRYDANLLPTVWIVGRNGHLLARSTTAPRWSDPKRIESLDHVTSQQL